MDAPFSEPPLQARQNGFDDDRQVHWWYTETGRIVKWSVFLGLLGLLLLYMIGGWFHARARLRKGLLPLGYHRWLVRRADLAAVDPRYAYPRSQMPGAYYQQHPQQRAGAGGWTTHRPADAYHMQDMGGAPPPPVYDPSSQRPPMYAPPDGGSKVDPAQSWGGPGGQDYAPPSGPPPPQGNGNGATNPFR